MAYSRELYTDVPVIEFDSNPYEMCSVVRLLNLHERAGNERDVGLLQILGIELPEQKYYYLITSIKL